MTYIHDNIMKWRWINDCWV